MRIYKFDDSNIAYTVDKTNQTVTARVTCPVNEKELCSNTTVGKMYAFAVAMGAMNLPELPDYFEATAHCKRADAFDVEKGKRVARLKLIKSVLKCEYNFMCAVRTRFQYDTEKCAHEITHNIRYRGSSIGNIISYLSKE